MRPFQISLQVGAVRFGPEALRGGHFNGDDLAVRSASGLSPRETDTVPLYFDYQGPEPSQNHIRQCFAIKETQIRTLSSSG